VVSATFSIVVIALSVFLPGKADQPASID